MAKKETGIVAAQSNLPAVGAMDFAADAGAGMEGAGQDAFAIPFLSVLQKSSPQVDEASGAAIENARPGMLFENVTGRLYSGKDGVVLVPCAYRREFLRWAARANGGGFKGAVSPEEMAEMRAKGQVVDLDGRLYAPNQDGSVNPEKSDRFNDTRNHYVLILDGDSGAWTEALVSLTSTQIKKSKMLMSALAAVKLKNSGGVMYTPPTFANKVRLTTIGESNDKGTWFGVKFEIDGQVDRPEIYAAAKAFHSSIAKGGVQVKYENDEPAYDSEASATATTLADDDGKF
jgi:hypothetical protein